MNKILLFINIFLLQAYLIRFKIGPLPTNLQEILIGMQALVFLGTIIKEKRLIKTIQNIKKYWIIIAFALLTLISILAVPVIEKLDFIRHLKFLLFASVLGFIFLETFKKPKEREEGIRIMGIGALSFGIFSVIYNLLGYNVAHDFRLLGPLDAAVYLAYYMTPFFIFFSIKFLENRRKKDYLAYAIILGILIIATRSMGAIGASLLIMLIYLFQKHRKLILKGKIRKILLVTTILLIAVVIFYSKILPTIQTEYSSLDERGEIWQTSIHLLKEPKNLIFGLGYGQFEAHYIQNVDAVLGRQPLDYYVIQPHNIFLLFTFHYGILGLLFLLLIIHKISREKATVFSYIILYFLIHGLIDTPFFKNDILIMLIIFLEMAVPLSKTRNQIQEN